MLKSFRRDCNAQSDNVNIVLHFDCNIQAFRPHRMHGVQRCGLLSQRVCMSLCLCVWWCLAEGYGTEIGAAVWAVWIGKIFCVHEYSCNAKLKDAESE